MSNCGNINVWDYKAISKPIKPLWFDYADSGTAEGTEREIR